MGSMAGSIAATVVGGWMDIWLTRCKIFASFYVGYQGTQVLVGLPYKFKLVGIIKRILRCALILRPQDFPSGAKPSEIRIINCFVFVFPLLQS